MIANVGRFQRIVWFYVSFDEREFLNDSKNFKFKIQEVFNSFKHFLFVLNNTYLFTQRKGQYL